jgi:eukaryotic-like serine/threonine-protein kinase
MTGQRLGDWFLGNEIGIGPVAKVYAATSSEPGRCAVVKVFHHPELQRPEFLARFPAEVLALHRLNHVNIGKYYEAGVHDGRAWLALEALEGVDVVTQLRRSAKPGEPGLSWNEEVLNIAVQVARALKHGHHRSVLHRDLKPSNLFLAEDGTVQLADFGLAKYLPVPVTSLPAEPFGTLGYLAPEHFNGKPVTRKSDMYSLGCLLYTLTTGRPPYTGTTVAEFTRKHCYTLPDRPALVVPDIPQELDELICALLAKDPNRRPQSAALVLEDLQQIRAKAERRGIKVNWPSDAPDTAAEIDLYSLTPTSSTDNLDPEPSRSLMSRPTVIVPLCLGFLAVVLALLFWPKPSAQELRDEATKLMQSGDPDDWDRAWADYWQPLQENYPDEFREEVLGAKHKIEDARELRQTLLQAKRGTPNTEAERGYRAGLKLLELGEPALARRAWGNVVTVYGSIVGEERWVRAARKALEETAKLPPPTGRDRTSLETALNRWRKLRKEGKLEEAKSYREALEEFYRDEPAVLQLLRVE